MSQVQDEEFDLSANVALKRNVEGNGFLVVEAASPIEVQFDNGGWLKRYEGDGHGVGNYNRVKVKSSTAQKVIVAFGFFPGGISSGRATFSGNISTIVQVPNQSPLTAPVNVPAGSSATLLAADTDRLEALIQMRHDVQSGDGVIYFSESNPGAAGGGGILEAGTSVFVPGEQAIVAYNPTASAIDVYVQPFKRV